MQLMDAARGISACLSPALGKEENLEALSVADLSLTPSLVRDYTAGSSVQPPSQKWAGESLFKGWSA